MLYINSKIKGKLVTKYMNIKICTVNYKRHMHLIDQNLLNLCFNA